MATPPARAITRQNRLRQKALRVSFAICLDMRIELKSAALECGRLAQVWRR